MDADTVMELADYYWAEKAVQNDLIREQRTKINRNLDERVRRLMDGVDDAKTKVPAAVIMRNRTPERNMRRIFGNAKGDEINDYLFRPVQDNEAERIRFVNRMHNEVRTFKDRNGKDRRLNKEERAPGAAGDRGPGGGGRRERHGAEPDIQNAAENIKNARKLAGKKDDLAKRRQAEIDASVDEAREFNLGTDERRLAIQYSRWAGNPGTAARRGHHHHRERGGEVPGAVQPALRRGQRFFGGPRLRAHRLHPGVRAPSPEPGDPRAVQQRPGAHGD